MDKLTPESFGATQASRIKNLLAGYGKPVRVEFITGVIDALDQLAAKLAAEMEPVSTPTEATADDTPADPSSEATSPGSQEGGSDDAGAETTTAPGEPGAVAPPV